MSNSLALPAFTRALPRVEDGHKPSDLWRVSQLAGRLLELSSEKASVAITATASLILDAQLQGEPVAWIATQGSTFYPPDFDAFGIDLGALPVMRMRDAQVGAKATEYLLRSGGFGLVVLDVGDSTSMRTATSARLAALAKKHRTVLVCLTRKKHRESSLGPMVSLRCDVSLKKIGFNQFTWELRVLKDRRHGEHQRYAEVCCGPDGLC